MGVKNWHRKPLIVEQGGNSRPLVFPKDMVVEYNSFLCTDRVALRLPKSYSDAEMRRAQNNYFSTTNPDLIADMVFDKDDEYYAHERVKYEPFLREPHPETPSHRLNSMWCSVDKDELLRQAQEIMHGSQDLGGE